MGASAHLALRFCTLTIDNWQKKQISGLMATPLVLEKYKFGECISNGFNGKVHKVFDKVDDTLYACRSVNYESISNKLIKQARKEWPLLKKVEHASVAQIIEVIDDESAKTVHYIMEYYPNGDLGAYIRKRAQEQDHVPEQLVWLIMTQLIEGLAYLHNPHKRNAQGIGAIVHRHLSPANVLLSEDNEVRISDFKVIRDESDSSYIADESYMKRQSYRSPETLANEPENETGDIWSLGCIIYELCTFQAPFVATDVSSMLMLQQMDHTDDISKLPAIYSDDLRSVLGSMLVANKKRRNSVVGLKANKTIREYNLEVHKLYERRYVRERERERTQRGLAPPEIIDYQRTPLMLAAEEGDIKQVKRRLKKDVGMQDLVGKTALMYAAQAGKDGVCRILLDMEARMVCKKGKTALIYATEAGADVCVELLAKYEAKMQSNDQRTALMFAIIKKNARAVQILAPYEHSICNSDNVTPTMLACCEGNPFAVNILSAYEAGMQDIKGWTALHYAAAQNSILCMNYLLDKEIKKLTLSGLTPLMIAAHSGHAKAIKRLLPYNKRIWDHENRTALMYAVRQGHLEATALLLDEEANFQDKQHKTALMMAVERNHKHIVEYMVKSSRVEWGLRNTQGYTALHMAVLYNYPECAALLLPREARVPILLDPHGPEYGETAFELAFNKENYQMAMLLAPVEGPRPTNEIDQERRTDLIRAAERGDAMSVICFANQAGCIDIYNKTALMYAAESNNQTIVKALIPYEANIEANGLKALTYALLNNHMEVAELLAPSESIDISKYSRLDNRETELMKAVAEGDILRTWCLRFQAGLRNTDGTTALMIAATTGNLYATRLLVAHEAGMRRNDHQRAYTLAMLAGNHGIAKILSDYEDTDLNVQNNTPLMLAAVENCIPDIKANIKYVGSRNADNKTALMFAAERGHLDAVKLLLEEAKTKMITTDWRNGYTALMLAAKYNKVSVCECLLSRERGMRNKADWTALMIAAQANSIDAARVLFTEEAGMLLLSGETTTCKTAMMIAAEYGRHEVVQLLLPYEAGKQTSEGRSALMFAAANGHVEVVNILAKVESRLQLSSRSSAPGSTAIHIAAEFGQLECVKALIPHCLAIKRNDGFTSLMLAASRNHLEIVKLLAERQIRLQANNGLSALMIAAARGYSDVVKVLMDDEAGLTNADGYTALMLAAQAGHADVCSLLRSREEAITHRSGASLLDMAQGDAKDLFTST